MSRKIRTALGVIGLVAAHSVAAQVAPDGLNYRFGLSLEHSDNMARRPVAVAETVVAPTLGFAYLMQGGRGEFEAAGSVSYRHYVDGRFDDEVNQTLGATGNWVFLPERLSWAFQGAIADQPLDPFRVDSPENRQRTHVFSTGPTLALRPTTRTRVLGELRYMNTRAERTPEFDGSRLGAAVRTLFALDASRTISAELESFDVDYQQNLLAPDYRRNNAFIRYARLGAKGELNADVGYSQVRFDQVVPGLDRTLSLPLARLRMGYALTDLSQLEVDVQRGFGDSAQDLLDGAPRAEDFALPIGRASLQSATLSADLFKQTGGRIGLSRRSQTTAMRFDGQWRRQEYLRPTGLDQTIRGFSVSANRQVRATFSVGAQAATEWRKFDSISREDRDTRLAIVADWRTSRRTGVSFEVSRGQRQSTDALQDYTDNRVLLSFNVVR